MKNTESALTPSARSINLIPRGDINGWTVTGTDTDGPFTKNFGWNLAAAQQFISDFTGTRICPPLPGRPGYTPEK